MSLVILLSRQINKAPNPIEYILECINTIYNVHHKNGDIRRVNVNIAANLIKLKQLQSRLFLFRLPAKRKRSFILHNAIVKRKNERKWNKRS